MNARATALAVRRERLVMRSAQLRQQVEEGTAVLRPAFLVADQVQDAWGWLRAHPEVVAGVSLALAVWRPRKVFGLGWRAWSAWKLVQRFRGTALDPRRFF